MTPPISFDGDNITSITMDGDSITQVTQDGDIVWEAADFIDSFENSSLSNYQSSSSFNRTSSSESYSGNYAIESTANAHQNMWWNNSLYDESSNEFATVSAWVYTSGTARGGPSLVNQHGDGYYAKIDNFTNVLQFKDLSENSSGSVINGVNISVNSNEWYQVVLEMTDHHSFTAKLYDNNGNENNSVSGTSNTHDVDTVGIHMFDANQPWDMLKANW